jgi:hypothetical protein
MSPIHRKHRRNAKPKPKLKPKAKHAPRFRNAGAAPRFAFKKEARQEATMKDRLARVGTTVLGAGAASLAGAAAVRYGFHPDLVSLVLGSAGLLSSAALQRDLYRDLGLGAASAAGSQFVLMHMHPPAGKAGVEDPKPQPSMPPPAPQAQPPQKRGNADLGSLPPGMLDAAFEQARAELVVSGDGYSPSYEGAPHSPSYEGAPRHYRHGPVYPTG